MIESRVPFAVALAIGITVAGCGGAEPVETAPAGSRSGREPAPQRGGGMQVTGIMGTIPPYLIQERLQPKLPEFQDCFSRRGPELEFVAGRIELYFHVKLNGSVSWVFPRGSTIGDRETERCILGIAARIRFPTPRGGGEAEFAWEFEADTPEDVRAPVDWEAARVRRAVQQNSGSFSSCGSGSANYTVTAYVAPGGRVLAAGADTSDIESAAGLDCVTDAVRSWSMPDPGSYPAKVTFRVP